MRKLPLTLCLLSVLGVAPMLRAQEAPQPPTIVLSQFQCDWSRVGDIVGELQLQIPIWEDMKANGRVLDAGTYLHDWADEWNVGRFIIATSMDEAIAANTEANERFAQEHPDATVFGEACPSHRDNFYLGGAVTESEAPDDGAPSLVFSMYRCDTNRIGEVMEEYARFSLPVYQKLVDQGALRQAGSFAHIWADEWNVGLFWVADDIPTFLGALDDSGTMFAAEATNVIGEACPVHRDNFYTMGPRTGATNGDGS